MTDAEQKGLGFHLRVRLALLAVVAVSLVAYYAPARSIPGLLVVATFAASGVVQYLLGRRYGRPVFWAGVFTIFEGALLIGVILTPITFPASWPPQMQLRLPTVFYLFVYVAGTALSYSPRLVVWTGAVTIGLWGLGHQIMLRLPGTVSIHCPAIDKPGLSPIASLELYLDPLYVSDAAWRTQTVLLALLTAVLAAAVARSRGLLRRQVTERALQCAWQLADETHRWSGERVKRGLGPVDIGIGVHYGEAVLGSIGDAQRLDYVVVGDTVNVASRLERLTRDLDVELVVSNAVIGRVREEGRLVGLGLDRLKPGGEVHVKGRMQPITIWTAEQGSAARRVL